MGKKYLETKEDSLESSILGVWRTAAEALDPVNKKAVKKDFDDRKDKDLDNDGDTDDSDKFLHKKRKAITKAVSKNKNDKKEVAEEAEELDEIFLETMAAVWFANVALPVLIGGGLVAAGGAGLGILKVISKIKEIKKILKDKKMQKFVKDHKGEKKLDPAAKAELNKIVSPAEKSKIKDEVEDAVKKEQLGEAYKLGTDEYRDYLEKLTPGEGIERAREFKVSSMKEALAKVWGLNEEDEEERAFSLDKDDKEKKVKGKNGKTETGKKAAAVDVNPDIKEKKK